MNNILFDHLKKARLEWNTVHLCAFLLMNNLLNSFYYSFPFTAHGGGGKVYVRKLASHFKLVFFFSVLNLVQMETQAETLIDFSLIGLRIPVSF